MQSSQDHVATLKVRKLNWTLSLLKRPRALVQRLQRSYRWSCRQRSLSRTKQSLVTLMPIWFEFCDLEEESVERFVGANNIIEHLQATLDAYTYAHPE